jgi:hypothetical protein|tara:strand:+ start:1372 stop:1608 length:237 start_codon:yes stop_codon:yes gene_type:complete
MNKYEVRVEFYDSRIIEIEAINPQEAEELAMLWWNDDISNNGSGIIASNQPSDFNLEFKVIRSPRSSYLISIEKYNQL